MIDVDKAIGAIETLRGIVLQDQDGDHMLTGVDCSGARLALAGLEDIFRRAAIRKPQIPLDLFK